MFCWAVRPDTWKSGNLSGPDGPSQAVVAIGHKLYSFGGSGEYRTWTSASQICVYILNTVALCWVKLPQVTTRRRGERPHEVPNMRVGHSAVLVEDIVYIWGDQDTKDNQLYAFNIDASRWLKTRVSGTVPEARSYHSACVLGKVMYVYGGLLATKWLGDCSNDMYKLDTTIMVWSLINTRGAASSHHSATVIGTKMFVFGGWGFWEAAAAVFSSGLEGLCSGCWLSPGGQWVPDTNDIRVFDTETDSWVSITPSTQLLPEQGCGHSAFAYNGELYVFGCHQTFNGLWKLNSKTLSWKKVEPKGKGPSKTSGTMHCCMVGDRVILFCRDLFILDLSPSMKTLCKMAVIQYRLQQSELPQDIRWELAVMTSVGNWHQVGTGIRWELTSGGNWKQVGTGRVRELAAARNWQQGETGRVRELAAARNWQQGGTGLELELAEGGNWQQVGTGSHESR